MNHWARRRRGAAVCAGVAALALALGGCGRMDNHPTIVGVVSPEALAAVPVAATVARPALSPAVASTLKPPAGADVSTPLDLSAALVAAPTGARTGVQTGAQTGAQQPQAAAATPARPAPALKKTTAIRPTAGRPAARTAKAKSAAAAATAAAPTSAPLVLPAPGGKVYDMSGTSSLGPPPKTMALTVADVPGGTGAQLWTFEGRTPDGHGVIENLTLARGADGVYMSAYRLELLAGLSVVFDFAPTKAVLLFPDRPQAGRSWAFDMESTDGCATVSTEGILAAARGDDAGAKHLRLTSTLVSTGRSACLDVNARRVQDIWQTIGNALPTRLDSDLSGSMGGVPVSARTTATLRPDTAATKP